MTDLKKTYLFKICSPRDEDENPKPTPPDIRIIKEGEIPKPQN